MMINSRCGVGDVYYVQVQTQSIQLFHTQLDLSLVSAPQTVTFSTHKMIF